MQEVSVQKLLSDVTVQTQPSPKTGKPYDQLCLKLAHGGEIIVFIERGYITLLKTLATVQK